MAEADELKFANSAGGHALASRRREQGVHGERCR
jgi:hypothetical protein